MKAKAINYFRRGRDNDNYEDSSECDMVYNNNELSVSYFEPDDNGKQIAVVYKGKEIKEGHFTLFDNRSKGRATLHTTDFCVFDGWWKEDGLEGMWQVVADKPVKPIG